MPGHKPRTNKGLAIAAVLMCLACGVSFTQSSASRSPIADTQTPDMFVAGNTDDSQIQSGGAAAENTDAEEENTPERLRKKCLNLKGYQVPGYLQQAFRWE